MFAYLPDVLKRRQVERHSLCVVYCHEGDNRVIMIYVHECLFCCVSKSNVSGKNTFNRPNGYPGIRKFKCLQLWQFLTGLGTLGCFGYRNSSTIRSLPKVADRDPYGFLKSGSAEAV